MFSDAGLVDSVCQCEPLRIDITNGEGLFGERPEANHFMIYFVMNRKVELLEQLERIMTLLSRLIKGLENCGSA